MTTNADREDRRDAAEERARDNEIERKVERWTRGAVIVQAAELPPMPPLPVHIETAEELADRLIAEERVISERAGTTDLPGHEGAVLTHALHIAARVASRFILNDLPDEARRYAGAFDVLDRRLSMHIARGAA